MNLEIKFLKTDRTSFWTDIRDYPAHCIIAGYPCTGKSTAAGVKYKLIDLESSFFSKANPLWLDEYYSLAINLYKQGFKVCVSSHDVEKLCRKMEEEGEDKNIIVVIPKVELKERWVEIAKERYMKERGIKNLKAWQRIEDYFEEDIERIKKVCKEEKITLCEMEGWL